MANIVQYGLRPAEGTNNIVVMRFYCDGSDNSTAIFRGDVVKSSSGGCVVASTAGAGLGQVGVVVGIYDANQNPVGHPNSLVSTKYLPASTVGYIDVALAISGAIFIGQSATTAYAQTNIWTVANIVATAGSTTTAQSNHSLGASGGSDLLLIGVVDNPNNALGAVNCDMYVHFNKSMFGLGTGAAV